MPYGLKPATLKQIIAAFAGQPKVEEVILFGSRAMGRQQEGSDIDLALRGKDLDMVELTKIYAATTN